MDDGRIPDTHAVLIAHVSTTCSSELKSKNMQLMNNVNIIFTNTLKRYRSHLLDKRPLSISGLVYSKSQESQLNKVKPVFIFYSIHQSSRPHW